MAEDYFRESIYNNFKNLNADNVPDKIQVNTWLGPAEEAWNQQLCIANQFSGRYRKADDLPFW